MLPIYVKLSISAQGAVPTGRGSAEGNQIAFGGIAGGDGAADAPRGDRLGEDFYDGECHCGLREAGTGYRAQQNARGTARAGISELLSRCGGALLRLVLRLLSA